jgi:hypothetical protein
MFFLNPWLLLGLSAAAVPIIIHLTGRRRYDPIPWAAMEFLLASHRETARRFKLVQLLLLLCRIMILALLVLAIARPTLPGQSWLAAFGEGNRHVCIVMDTSFSMRYRPGDDTLFERAKDMAGSLLSTLSPGDTVSLLTVADDVDVVLRGETRKNEIDRAIQRLDPTSRTTDLYPGVREGLQLLEETPQAAQTLYLFTDGARHGWNHDRAGDWQGIAESLESLDNPPRIEIILIGPAPAPNAAVTGVEPEPRILTPGRPVRLRVTAHRWGTFDHRECRFSLTLAGEERGTIRVPWAKTRGGGTATGVFTVPVQRPGSLSGSVSIEADNLPGDDVRSFGAVACDGIRVLCVDGEEADQPEDSETFFLLAALDPGPAAGPVRANRVRDTDLVAASLEDTDVIILANVGYLRAETLEALKDRVYAGTGLMVFPGDRVSSGYYDSAFGPGFMPARLGEPEGTPGEEESIRTISRIEETHPAFDWFREEHLAFLARSWVYRSFPLAPNSESATVLAAFGLARPAVVEDTYGAGKVVLFAFPADTEWSNLPTQPVYLPLLHGLVYSLVGEGSGRRNITVGDTFLLRATPEDEAPMVTAQSGAVLGRMEPGEEGWWAFAETGNPGLLFVSAGGESLPVAVNIDPGESELDVLSEDRLREVIGNLPAGIRSLPEEFTGTRGPEGPVEIWPVFLSGCLVFLLMELVLATWLDRHRSTPASTV